MSEASYIYGGSLTKVSFNSSFCSLLSISSLSLISHIYPLYCSLFGKNTLTRQLLVMAIEIEQPSVGLSKVAVSDTHGEDSPYFAGWKAYDENPYDELNNPLGVIQMGLAENQVRRDH